MELHFKYESKQKCETDIVIVTTQLNNDRPAILIGECKTRGPIDERDVANLSEVSDQLAEKLDIDHFILFSKTFPFGS